MSSRLNKQREEALQPLRMQYAKEEIAKLGYQIEYYNQTFLTFYFKGSLVKMFPYSGWHTGKTIKDGRGIEKLLKQIQP